MQVDGQEQARAVPGVGGLEITIARGRPVVPLPDGDRYLGFLFARGSTADGGRALPARGPLHAWESGSSRLLVPLPEVAVVR